MEKLPKRIIILCRFKFAASRNNVWYYTNADFLCPCSTSFAGHVIQSAHYQTLMYNSNCSARQLDTHRPAFASIWCTAHQQSTATNGEHMYQPHTSLPMAGHTLAQNHAIFMCDKMCYVYHYMYVKIKQSTILHIMELSVSGRCSVFSKPFRILGKFRILWNV